MYKHTKMEKCFENQFIYNNRSVAHTCVIIVLGIICIIFTIGTLVCSVEIFRIALPMEKVNKG